MTFVRVGNHLFDVARIIHVEMITTVFDGNQVCVGANITIDGEPTPIALTDEEAQAFDRHVSGRVTTETRDVPGFGHVLDLTPRVPTTTGREESPNRQPETA